MAVRANVERKRTAEFMQALHRAQQKTRAAAARDKASADIEHDLERNRATAQAQPEQLRETADAGKGKISDWWTDVQKNWNDHVARLQENIESKKAEMDKAKADRRADDAEADANFRDRLRLCGDRGRRVRGARRGARAEGG